MPLRPALPHVRITSHLDLAAHRQGLVLLSGIVDTDRMSMRLLIQGPAALHSPLHEQVYIFWDIFCGASRRNPAVHSSQFLAAATSLALSQAAWICPFHNESILTSKKSLMPMLGWTALRTLW